MRKEIKEEIKRKIKQLEKAQALAKQNKDSYRSRLPHEVDCVKETVYGDIADTMVSTMNSRYYWAYWTIAHRKISQKLKRLHSKLVKKPAPKKAGYEVKLTAEKILWNMHDDNG